MNLGIHAYKTRHTLEAQHSRTHTHNTRYHSLLLPHERLNTTQNSLHYRVPILWNSIPIEIQNSKSLMHFKKSYKKHLINKY